MTDLLGFLQQHADDALLDTEAMQQLNVLTRSALVAWPDLQQVLEANVTRLPLFGKEPCFPWTDASGFARSLDNTEVFAMTHQLMLQVKKRGKKGRKEGKKKERKKH